MQCKQNFCGEGWLSISSACQDGEQLLSLLGSPIAQVMEEYSVFIQQPCSEPGNQVLVSGLDKDVGKLCSPGPERVYSDG